MLYYSYFFKLPATQGEFFFLSQTSTIDRKLVSENMKMRCFIHWRKFFFGERMSSTHLYNIVTKCCCCSRLLSNKEFCTIFPVEEMPVYAPWACTMQWQKDAKEAMIPISALFLAKAQLYKKNLCTQIRRYLKLEKNRFAGAFLDAVIATHISFQSGKKLG